MTAATIFLSLLSAGVLLQVDPGVDGPQGVSGGKLAHAVRAEIRTGRLIVPAGGEVIVEFVVQNRTNEPVTLRVPDARAGRDSLTEMGLPLEHVFSAVNFRGLEVATDQNPTMGDRIMRRPEYPVPSVTLAPFGTVGLRFDVAKFYPGLHQVGTYVLRWRPYGGALESNVLVIKVVDYKQVIMDTDYGPITMSLLYDKAPRTVDNFLELVRDRFYSGKVFHIARPNLFVQGGCPNGDGTGRRPDGITIPPEFNDTPFDVGTVAMALAEPDANSASCQFFICLARQTKWDGRYTAFAQVEGPESLAALRKMAEVETDKDFHPVKPLRIKNMSIVDARPQSRSGL